MYMYMTACEFMEKESFSTGRNPMGHSENKYPLHKHVKYVYLPSVCVPLHQLHHAVLVTSAIRIRFTLIYAHVYY